VYGIGAAGEAGVDRVVELLTNELTLAMALSGKASLAELDPSLLDLERRRPVIEVG
jgi:isopentenyl diphosphate isomerase/L-lactate dehydrogenase-like FMN-dependent dehydrogenase